MPGLPNKAVVSGWFRPVARRFARAGATANQVTLMALGASALAGGAVALWPAADWPSRAAALGCVVASTDGLLWPETATRSDRS
jgi:hypothetical protein